MNVISSISAPTPSAVNIDTDGLSDVSNIVLNATQELKTQSPDYLDFDVIQMDQGEFRNEFGDIIFIDFDYNKKDGDSNNRRQIDCDIEISCNKIPKGTYTGDSLMTIEFY